MSKFNKCVCALLVVALLVTTFSGCGNSVGGNEKEVDNEVEALSQQSVDNKNVINKEKLYILKANSFKDGYAVIELGDARGDYKCHAIINKKEEVVATISMENKIFKGSNGKLFYFYGDSTLICVDNTGKEVFEEVFLTDGNIASYDNIDLNDDGMICPIRKYGGINGSAMQYALIDSEGKYIKDWSYLKYNGSIVDFAYAKYCGEGILVVQTEDESVYMKNIYEDKSYKLDGVEADRSAGELHAYMLGGFISIGDCIVSKNGDIVNSDVDAYFAYSGNEDEVVYDHDEFTLYDVSMKNKIAEIDFSDEIKSKMSRYGNYKKGYMPLTVTGSDGRMYTTLINTKGQQVFEPVNSSETVVWNGENLIISRSAYELDLDIYDKAGNLVTSVSLPGYDPKNPSVYYDDTLWQGYDGFGNEGYWIVGCYHSASQKYNCYLKSDGTLLFPDGTIEVVLP